MLGIRVVLFGGKALEALCIMPLWSPRFFFDLFDAKADAAPGPEGAGNFVNFCPVDIEITIVSKARRARKH